MLGIITFVISFAVSYNNYMKTTPEQKVKCYGAVLSQQINEQSFGVTNDSIRKNTLDSCTMYEIVKHRQELGYQY